MNPHFLVFQGTATRLPHPDDFFDAVSTDPPYYDVPYYYLWDFFYFGLKRTLGEVYPDLFSAPLRPIGTQRKDLTKVQCCDGAYLRFLCKR